ncbi:MAG: SDR family NAD(P)-dependent oxidoreductase [Cyclobacteriaceae bacterium]|jgi:NAD(P)-dependent dehydrogenase (short-subunit alcohol dehydrogenase family)|nr:SDR family oxidoreductase [Flammeovirgaceae bacterium]MDB4314674.1 SDR family oxidoreductase [Cyclobacteriaceae bacterium]MDB4741768.1 SDR family oxidoreductase [Cyclobacteriaceae bacterium]|tara:strand:+ start:245 stop:991 length:747 start_codon:yes stop_codon:yes gene_type:complete
MSFKEKVIVITGAGSGIGAATVRFFAKKEAYVVLADISLEKMVDIADSIPMECMIQKTDVSQYDQMQSLAGAVIKKYGQIDVWVNNAGIGPTQMLKTADHSLQDWERVIAVNQSGVFYGMKVALPAMLKQGSGNIVNVASLAGLKASGNNISYVASKFAVVGMTKAAALEYAKKNIRINAVCPGYTDTNMLRQLLEVKPEIEDKLKNHIPMGRFGKATEVATAIGWLASDQTQFMTGQTLSLDGGTSL